MSTTLTCSSCTSHLSARTTTSTYEELVAVKAELARNGHVVVREGRDRNFRYFVDWATGLNAEGLNAAGLDTAGLNTAGMNIEGVH